MTLTIYTNIEALRLQRSLDSNQAGLARTIQRLSSGLRVGSAADDAAGMAIATRMDSQVRGSRQAIRNAGDALSSFQTAEAQLAQLTALLQRARELGVQAGNDIYTSADRTAFNKELQQSLAEIDRIASSTTFNGQKLLDGSGGSLSYQIGAGATDTMGFTWNANMRLSAQGALQMVSSSDLRTSGAGGGGGFQFSGTYTTVPIGNLDFSIPASPFRGGAITTSGPLTTDYSSASGSFKVDGSTVTLNANYGTVTGLANAIQLQLNGAHPGWYGVSINALGDAITVTKTGTASNPTAAVTIDTPSGSSTAAFTSGTQIAGAAAVTATFAGFSVDGNAVFLNTDHSGDVNGLISDIQMQLDHKPGMAGVYQVSGSTAGISISRPGNLVPPSVAAFVGTGASTFAQAAPATLQLASGDLQIQMANGPALNITGSFATPYALANAIMQKVRGLYASVDSTTGVLKLLSSGTFTVSGTQAGAGGVLGFDASTSQTNGSLAQINLLSSSSALEVVMRVDAALDSVNQSRSTLGAMQNRLDAVVSNLELTGSNLSIARGRIVDADYAQDMSHLLKTQILQQAAQAMLAQASLTPRNVLALLR